MAIFFNVFLKTLGVFFAILLAALFIIGCGAKEEEVVDEE